MRDFERKAAMEKISARMDRIEKRAKIASVVPPIPISFCAQMVDESGIFGVYMVAADGVITNIHAYVQTVEKDSSPFVEILVQSTGLDRSYKLPIKQGAFSLSIEFPIYAGDRVLMKVSDSKKLSGLWFSCLYEIVLQKTVHEYFLIEELTKKSEEAAE